MSETTETNVDSEIINSEDIEKVKKGNTKEAETVAEDANVITGPKKATAKKSVKQSSVGDVRDGIIGSKKAHDFAKKSASVNEDSLSEKVAIHSTHNTNWTGVGKVKKGYNIVSKEASEKWLTRKHVRLATPEEVASEFGY